MVVDYKKIGLVNTKEMFARAIKGGWAVPDSHGRAHYQSAANEPDPYSGRLAHRGNTGMKS
jgi:hypothetical protein